jgi:hypothetical protein
MDTGNRSGKIAAAGVVIATVLAERYLNKVAAWIETNWSGAGSTVGVEAAGLLSSSVRALWALIPAVAVFVFMKGQATAAARRIEAAHNDATEQVARARRDLDQIASELRTVIKTCDEKQRKYVDSQITGVCRVLDHLTETTSRASIITRALGLLEAWDEHGEAGVLIRANHEDEPALRLLELLGVVRVHRDFEPGTLRWSRARPSQ